MTNTVSYEDQRAQNIRDNEALLLSLGLHIPTKKPVAKPVKKPVKKPVIDKPVFKKPKTEDSSLESKEVDRDGESGGLRRSGRARKSISYNDTDLERASRERDQIARRSLSVKGVKRERQGDSEGEMEGEDGGYERERQRFAARLGVRTQDPKTFGHIPGVEVGTWWSSRMECSTAAIHAPTVAGISGNPEEGAWSVALSGGYPDDVDLGEAFTYTGSGGRDLKGTKQNPKNLRSAPQTYDQSFENSKNAALKKSAETRKPVRVIRGFKLDSPYAPPEGYRYDGLYIVEKAWMARGLTKGLLVCRYAFKRMEGQPELPVRSADDEEVDQSED